MKNLAMFKVNKKILIITSIHLFKEDIISFVEAWIYLIILKFMKIPFTTKCIQMYNLIELVYKIYITLGTKECYNKLFINITSTFSYKIYQLFRLNKHNLVRNANKIYISSRKNS